MLAQGPRAVSDVPAVEDDYVRIGEKLLDVRVRGD